MALGRVLSRNFPSGRIDLGQASGIDLAGLTSDPADAHVCALAVAAEANYLFTHDRGYLRDGLKRYEVQVEVLARDVARDFGPMAATLIVHAPAGVGRRSRRSGPKQR